ncbi:MAG: hypothetical protein ABFC86_02230 [Rectinema sp.]
MRKKKGGWKGMIDKELQEEIDATLKAGGLDLLEFSLTRQKAGLRVKAVIYRPEGTGTDECARAYRLILPRIQMALGVQDPYIEVYSPGIDRVFRTEREWIAFKNCYIKFMTSDSHDWKKGRILHFDNGKVQIEMDDTILNIPIASIIKAKLDSSRKGEKVNGI